MEDLRKLKDEATKAFTKGRFSKAVELWEQVCSGDPKDLGAQIKLGDAFAKAGKKPQAVKTYQVVAEAYATQGFLPKAIAVCKVLLEVDPSHNSTQKILADLYAKKLGREPAAPPAGPSEPLVAVAAAPAPPLREENELELDTRDHASGLGSGPSAAERVERVAAEPSARSPKTLVPPPPPQAALEPEPRPAPVTVRPSSRVDLPIALEIEPSNHLIERHGVGRSPFEEGRSGSEAPVAPADARPASATEQVPAATLPAPGARLPRPAPKAELEWATAPDDSIEASLEATLQRPRTPAPQAVDALGELDLGEIAPGEPSEVELSFEVPLAGSTEEEIEILSITAEVVDQPAQPARPLPRIPLFSDLAPEAFVELMEKCGFVRAEPGRRLLEEGTPGNSFFVICSGKMRVVKQSNGAELTMAYLTEGAFFGEMALLAGTPRAATVIAEEESELLEVAAPVLNDLARRYPHVAASLKQFGRQRLLANVMATSALFRPFDRADRKRLAELFKVREFMAGERVVAEGKPTDGLYLIMAGEMEVTRRLGGNLRVLATLKDGDVFGEMSLLSKRVASADVTARRRSTVLRLPRDRFEELIVTYPQVLVLLSELADSRTRSDAKVMASVLPSDALQPAV